jgi:predicted nucleic acid-binding protein
LKLKVIEEDLEDSKILDCALQAKAKFIVSGDKHLLRLKKFRNIKILTPRKFLDVFKNKF